MSATTLKRIFAIVGVTAAAAVIAAIILFMQRGGDIEDASIEDVMEDESLAFAEFTTKEATWPECPSFTFAYPQDWELNDDTNANGVHVEISNGDAVKIFFEAHHTSGMLGGVVGTRATITELAPTTFTTHGDPDQECMVGKVVITGIKSDYFHVNGYADEDDPDGASFIAVVPDSWKGDWVNDDEFGHYPLLGAPGNCYMFTFHEQNIENREHDEYGGSFVIGFYCENANSLSDKDRELVVATLASLREA